MNEFAVEVIADKGNTGTNKVEVHLGGASKQTITVLTERGDRFDEHDDEPRVEDVALYYAVERISQLEKQQKLMADAIADAAVSAGILRKGAALSGPMLLILCQDLSDAALHQGKDAEGNKK